MGGNDLFELEARLERHFSLLNDALDHDRRLAMDAAWGVVQGFDHLSAIAAAVAVAYFLDINKWLEGALVAFAYLGVLGYSTMRTQRARELDLAKLSTLPEWERRWD